VVEIRREALKPSEAQVKNNADERQRLREQKREQRLTKKAERRLERVRAPEKSTTDEHD
jgi:hypothetical protein